MRHSQFYQLFVYASSFLVLFWEANTREGKGVQNSSSTVKNCTKCVQNYGTIVFWNSKMGGYVFQPPKFELQKLGTGRVYKIGARLYKIVQNVYKIMASSLFLKFEDGETGGMDLTSFPFTPG